MSDFKKTIEVIVETTTSKAKQGLSSLRGDIAETDGTFAKLKTGAGGVFDGLKAAGPAALAGVGAAVGAFALASVGKFSDLAISAEKFSAAAGTSVEDASRWIEVAGDLGVNTDAVQGAMSRLNREADAGKLAQYGITATNANERLTQTLKYLASIPDEGERSAKSFELLGKGGAALSPLIANVGTLDERLASVSSQKVIDPAEVEEARDYADAVDNLGDEFGDFQLQIGQALIGPLTDAAERVGDVVDVVQQLIDMKDELPEAGGGLLDTILGTAEDIINPLGALKGYITDLGLIDDAGDGVASSQQEMGSQVATANEELDYQAEASGTAEDALRSLSDATLAMFNDQLRFADAVTGTSDKVADYTAKLAISTAASGGNAEANKATTEAQNDAASAALSQAAAAVKNAESMAAANGVTLTASERNSILVQNLQGVANTLAPGNPLRVQLESYIGTLNRVPGNVSTEVSVDDADALRRLNNLAAVIRAMPSAQVVGNAFLVGGQGGGSGHWAGGDVAQGEGGTLAEEGAELVVPRAGGGARVLGATDTRAMLGRSGGSVTNVYVMRPALQSDRDVMAYVARLQRRYSRINGKTRITET